MELIWGVLAVLWVCLQVWYWTAFRTLKVVASRMESLSNDQKETWKEWIRDDKPYDSWWRPLLSGAIVFPVRGLSLAFLAAIQLIIVVICAPFCGYEQRTKMTYLQISWLRVVLRNLIVAFTWVELRCMGIVRVEEYEVLNRDFESISIEEAVEKIKVRELVRIDCSSRDEPKNYVSNHVSYVDIIVFIAMLYPSFCSKSSVANIPLIGHSAKALNCIFIDRSSAADRRKVLDAIARRQTKVWQASTCFRNISDERLRALADMRAAEDKPTYETTSSLLVFPEGTTSNGQYLLPFKKGAFVGMKPVSPVILSYECPYFNMSYEVLPIIWLFPVMAGCWQGVTLKMYWMPELFPSVEMSLHRSVGQYTQYIRDCMGKVLLAVTSHKRRHPTDLKNISERWNGDLQTKRECIATVYK